MHAPDPLTQGAFYDSLPTKRLFAWVIDVVLITAFCLLLTPVHRVCQHPYLGTILNNVAINRRLSRRL